MNGTMRVSGTLSVDVYTNGDLHLVIERAGAGLVRVEPGELAGLVAILRAAAGELSLALERLERGTLERLHLQADVV